MKRFCEQLLVVVFLTLSPIYSLSQQGNNWYFGEGAGISFNTGSPTALTDGALYTEEGCSTISDSLGRLLFYTDGRKVYNKQHKLMPNGTGLAGHTSSTTSSLIIAWPGSDHLYYIFTADAAESYPNMKGYRYSVVDMNLDGGNGDIITKNELLSEDNTEKLSATAHANGVDIWLVTKMSKGNYFKSFRITCNGVDPNPVISQAGTVLEGMPRSPSDLIAIMKISPDGKKLASPVIIMNKWEIFDFNDATGIVSNALSIPIVGNRRIFGLEFSPNSKLLYAFTECCWDDGTVYQFKIDVHDSTTIVRSKYIVDSSRGWKGAGQLGPDGKIYYPESHSPKLTVINYPDVYGPGCNVSPNAIDLVGRNSMRALPYFYSGAISDKAVDYNYTVNADCKTVTFTGSSSIPGPINWEWNFGDGTKASGQTVTHAFSDIGDNFNVLLTAVNPGICGGKGRKMKNIRFNRVAPKAQIILPDSCGSKTVLFRDGSSIVSGRVINWLWDFGDGTISTEKNPVHSYNSYGAYQVTLTATADDGCQTKDLITKNYSIRPKPQADFTFNKACVGEIIHFSDQSSIDENNISEWKWKFGDGSTIQLQHPEKLFSSAQNQSIELIVKSAEGCSDTSRKTISVSSKPIADFAIEGICVGAATKFSDRSTVANNQISKWHLEDGNNQTHTTQSPEINYAQAGDYTIKFAVSSASGCISDTLKRTVTIGSKPLADFEFVNNCGEKTGSFTNKSTNNNQPITKWFWDLGDSKSATTQNILHLYSAFGTYTVSYVATSSIGCSSDTVQKTIDIKAKPKSDFAFKDGCVNSSVAFNDVSTLAAGTINQWKWLVNNNTALTQKNIQQQFSSFGIYPVRLIVTSDKDCSDTLTKTVSVETKPVADFSINNGCEGLALKPTNNSSIAFGSIAKHHWDFGNGAISTIDRPSYAYPVHGNYITKYTVVSKNGCVADTVQRTVSIESIPVVSFQFGNTCAGKEIQFSNLSSNQFGDITKWKWNFGNADNSELFEPAYAYQKYGNYLVSLSATTVNGCTAEVKKTINIARVLVSAGNDTIASVGQPLQLNARGAKNYQWLPAIGLNSAIVSNPITLLQSDQTYMLKGMTAEGCVGYDTLSVKVFKLADIYVPNAFTPNGDGKNDFLYPICAGIKSLEHFTVFNRWGEIVFTTKKTGEKWNGYIKNLIPATTTFVWMVKGVSYDGRVIERKGTTTLIK